MPLSDDEWDFVASVRGGWTPEMIEEKRQARRREARWKQERQRRERLRTNGPRESFTLEDIGDRDGWVCGLCLDPIDRKFAAPDPRSPSIDHVKAIAAGGAHTRDNVRITHLYCNMDRSYIDRPRRLILRDRNGQIILDQEVHPRTPEQARGRLARRVARHMTADG
jgi:HNH endonuclease